MVMITLLFLDFSGFVGTYFGWMAKLQFLPAVLSLNVLAIIVVVALTLLFGRVYCSVVCPLGVLQDVFAWISKRFKKNKYSYSAAKYVLRLGVLCVFVLLFLIGFNHLAMLIAPYSAYGRIATSLMQPIYIFCNNLLANFAEESGSYSFAHVEVISRGTLLLVVAVLTLVMVGFLAWRGGRTWCNTICPVGTVLGYLSKFSYFKMMIDTDKCISCGLCEKNCKASCIDSKSHKIDHSRCVACMDCVEKCHKDALKFVPARSVSKASVEPVDESRRKFISVASLLFTTATIKAQQKKVDGGLAAIADKTMPERKVSPKPAGALSVKNFESHCTSCQLCISECPNMVLRPSTSLEHLLQPVMSFEEGYCRPECTRCSELCPTGAIRPITPAEKSSIKIGHAVVLRENCLVNTQGIDCGNCARHCPVGAILMVPRDSGNPDSPRVPVVNEARCIGCGACENLCPSRPVSAIYVEGYESHQER